MKFKSFQEYLDANKKLVEKPKVTKVADYEGKQVEKPGKEDKHKDAGGKGPVGEPQPYIGGKAAKDRNSDDPKALGHEGDKKMVYEPDVDASLKDVKTWPKVDVAEWVKENKNLSLAEFTKKIRNENKGSKIYETAKLVAEDCKNNSKNITSFVREIKRNNLLEAFLFEMLKNEESFKVLGQLLTQNEFYANKLDLVISEMVAAPVGLGSEEDPSEEGDDDEEGAPSEEGDDEEGAPSEEGDDEEGAPSEEGDDEEGEEGTTHVHHHHHHHHHHHDHHGDDDHDHEDIEPASDEDDYKSMV